MSFRKEEKLKVEKGQLLELYDWIYKNGGVELHAPRIVSSTYFDNDSWNMFKDSEEGSVPRKKIRVRSYYKEPHAPGTSALEVKTSSIEGRYKTITTDFDLKKLMNIGFLDQNYGICRPKVRVTYQREYYKIFNVRLTIDKNIEYRAATSNWNSAHKVVDKYIAVEVKAPDEVAFEYLNRKFPFDRVRFSKYSRAIESILDDGS